MQQPTTQRDRRRDDERVKTHRPPPDPRQVRRELGWELAEAEREATAEQYRRDLRLTT